jgi:hypothetical protein
MEQAKLWLQSKTVLTSIVAIIVAAVTKAGYLDAETGAQLQVALVSLAIIFLRIGGSPLGTPEPTEVTPVVEAKAVKTRKPRSPNRVPVKKEETSNG